MDSYYLNGREKSGRILLKNAKFMRKRAFKYLVRGTGEFAGVVADIRHELEESTGKRKTIAVVIRPDGKVEEENLMVFDKRTQDFEPVYYDLGDIFILTARPSPDDDQNLMMWLPPEEAKPVHELKKEIRTLEISYNEMAQHAEEADHARMLYEMEVRHARSLQMSLERQLKSMSGRLVTIEGEVEMLRAKMQSRHALVMAMKEQISEMAQSLMKLSKYEGMEAFELTKKVLGNVEELVELMSSQEPEEMKKYSDQLAILTTEIKSLKQGIKDSSKQAQSGTKTKIPKQETPAEMV